MKLSVDEREECMMKEQQMNNKGFTLVELAMSIVISAFVIAAAYSIVIAGTKSYETTNKSATLQQEITFVNNMIGEATRAGDKQTAVIWKQSDVGDKVLYLGDAKKVFCYKAGTSSLYVYEATTSPFVYVAGVLTVDVNVLKDYLDPVDTSILPNHLVSKYVKSFDVSCETNNSTVSLPTVTDYQSGVKFVDEINNRDFSMIRVKTTMKYLNKSDSAEVVYQIRN